MRLRSAFNDVLCSARIGTLIVRTTRSRLRASQATVRGNSDRPISAGNLLARARIAALRCGSLPGTNISPNMPDAIAGKPIARSLVLMSRSAVSGSPLPSALPSTRTIAPTRSGASSAACITTRQPMLCPTRMALVQLSSPSSAARSAPKFSIVTSAGVPGVAPCPRRSHASTSCWREKWASCGSQSV